MSEKPIAEQVMESSSGSEDLYADILRQLANLVQTDAGLHLFAQPLREIADWIAARVGPEDKQA